MPMDDTFASFSHLPPEIRLKVWSHALSIWAVCTAKLDVNQPDNDDEDLRFVVRPIGATFLPVAQSCKEARSQLLQLLNQSGSNLGTGELVSTGPWSLKPWFILHTGVLFLDFANYHVEFVRSLPADHLSLIRHAVVVETKFPHAISICIVLQGKCPNLRTIQIEWTHRRKPSSVSLDAAKRYTAIARSAEQSQSNEKLDVDFFRDLYESFHQGWPRILVLKPRSK